MNLTITTVLHDEESEAILIKVVDKDNPNEYTWHSLKYDQVLDAINASEGESDGEVDAQFEVFWNKYDRKENRAKSLARWRKLKKHDRKKIMETVDDFVACHPDRQYRPMVTTYLNNRRWEDELPTAKRKPSGNASYVNTWRY